MATNRPAINYPIDLDKNNRSEVHAEQDSALPNLPLNDNREVVKGMLA